MRIKTHLFFIMAIGCLFAFSGQTQAQCSSCNQAAAAPIIHQQPFEAPVQATAGCGCSKGCLGGCRKGHSGGCSKGCLGGCRKGHSGGGCANGACDLPGPTVPAELPKLPIETCCGSPMGYGHVPSLLTPPRSYIPPIGKAVGRPLIGRWTGC